MKRIILFLMIILLMAACEKEGVKEEGTLEENIEECSDECTFSENKCIGNKVYKCEDVNGDGCKELKLIEECKEECEEGECVKAFCGDGKCDEEEDCNSCSEDCGLCINEEEIEYGLGDYPEPFILNNQYNKLKIVIGDEGTFAETLSATSIASGLQSSVSGKVPPNPIIAKELESLDYNLILIGNACTNKYIAQYLDKKYKEEDCEEGLNKDEAVIELRSNNGKVALLVMAINNDDFRRAGIVLQNYDKFDLSGNKQVIRGSSLSIEGISVG